MVLNRLSTYVNDDANVIKDFMYYIKIKNMWQPVSEYNNYRKSIK